jgi:hypothetical protein
MRSGYGRRHAQAIELNWITRRLRIDAQKRAFQLFVHGAASRERARIDFVQLTIRVAKRHEPSVGPTEPPE